MPCVPFRWWYLVEIIFELFVLHKLITEPLIGYKGAKYKWFRPLHNCSQNIFVIFTLWTLAKALDIAWIYHFILPVTTNQVDFKLSDNVFHMFHIRKIKWNHTESQFEFEPRLSWNWMVCLFPIIDCGYIISLPSVLNHEFTLCKYIEDNY